QVRRILRILERSGELRRTGTHETGTIIYAVAGVPRGDKLSSPRGDRNRVGGTKRPNQGGHNYVRQTLREPTLEKDADFQSNDEEDAAALRYWKGQEHLLKRMPA